MKENTRSRFEETLSKKHACYILITCDKPNGNDQMHVEMSHAGDIELVSYLLQGAQDVVDQQLEDESPLDADLKILK